MSSARRSRAAAGLALAALALTFATAFAEAPKPAAVASAKATIPVAMYDGAGVGGKGPKMLEEKLEADTEFRITRVTPEQIRAGKLKGYKALIVPGGSSQTEGTALGEDGRDMIRGFVAEGNTYVGICAGCYLASSQYKWSLHILPVKVIDSANWERGKATLRLELSPEGKEWLAHTGEARTIYHNGPILEAVPEAKEKLIPLATYKEEITKKGAKAGLMKETPAIAAARYEKGWAIGVSPHPEQTDGLKDFVPAALRWAMAHPASLADKATTGQK